MSSDITMGHGIFLQALLSFLSFIILHVSQFGEEGRGVQEKTLVVTE
jgi:hypothetical protein